MINFEKGLIYSKRDKCYLDPKPDANGYKYLTVDGKQVGHHRYIYEMYHKVSLRSYEVIDHHDHNRTNNSISNLFLSTFTQNSQNRKVRSDSKSGVKGVEKVGKRFRSVITINKKRQYLGTFDTIEEAVVARQKKIQEANKVGARFNE